MAYYNRHRIPNARLRATQEYLYYHNAIFEDRVVAMQRRLFEGAFLQIQTAGLPAPNRLTHEWRRRVEAQLPGIVAALKTRVWQTTRQAAATAYAAGFWGKAWQLDQISNRDVVIRAVPRPSLPQMREDLYDTIIQNHLTQDWLDLYGDNLDALTSAIKTALWTSVAQGETFAQSMQRVAGVIGITDRKTFRSAFNRIQSLTRQVINRTLNEAAWELFKDNQPIVTYWEWLTASDERVCPRCAILDGIRMGSEAGWLSLPPEHFNCRCTIVPVPRFDWMFSGLRHPRKPFVAWVKERGYDLATVMDRYLKANPEWLEGQLPTDFY